MTTHLVAVERERDAIHAIASRHHERSVSVFGSVARGDDQPGTASVPQVLVEFEPGASLVDLMAIQNPTGSMKDRMASHTTFGEDVDDDRDLVGLEVGCGSSRRARWIGPSCRPGTACSRTYSDLDSGSPGPFLALSPYRSWPFLPESECAWLGLGATKSVGSAQNPPMPVRAATGFYPVWWGFESLRAHDVIRINA